MKTHKNLAPRFHPFIESYLPALAEPVVPQVYQAVIERQVVRAFEDGIRDERRKKTSS